MKTFLAYIIGLLACFSIARAEVPDCEALAEMAARAEGVPAGLMSAIARVESGYTVGGAFRAWPWTLNKAGKGRYLATQQEALAILDSALASGRRNIDIGCMQINWHWHGAQFATLAQMIDPVENTRYAARYLRDLHQRLGDWELAVMRYHSADGARGRAYMQRVRGQMGRPSPPASPPSASQLAMQAQDSRHAGQRNGLLARPGVALVALERAGPLQGRQGPNR